MSVIIDSKRLGFPWETQDPFLFCVYHKDEFPAGDEKMAVPNALRKGRNIGHDFTIRDGFRMYHGSEIPGFPYHPHRGFETVTINKQGVVDHSDSLGAAGRFMAGDVQWMTAGKGVQHSEMFPLVHQDKENTLEIFQIWLNLPKKSKFVEPHFRMLWKEEVPVLEQVDEAGKKTVIDVVAGNVYGTEAAKPTPDSWAAEANHAVGILTIRMEAGAKWTLPATLSTANRSLYFYAGKALMIGDEKLRVSHLAHLKAGIDIELQNGEAEAYLLILQGQPINEPVVSYGPFVMNSEAEIQQAFADYRRTEFGGWPWDEREKAHPREKGRFALHADGREEER